MDMMINFKKIILKLNKIKKKNSKNFFKNNKQIYDLIKKKKVKKKQDNLNSSQVQKKIKKILSPNIEQLYFLHNLITFYNRVTVLELGVGWSTSVISDALNENKKKYLKKINGLRFNDPYKLFSIDNNQRFINIAKKRLSSSQKKNTNFKFSNVRMIEVNKRICTEFENIPKINPDMIFIDGPSIYNVKGNINGFNTGHPDLAPMSADILKIEPFLKPGTFLLLDGRTLNALFLKNFLYRNWNYKYFKNFDIHLFFLNGPLLGELNIKQLKFQKLT